ncbi:hypothetical protein AAMO2058_000089600 [Amorphochlora amoebiformis]
MSESKSIFSPPGDRLKYNHVHFYAEKLENLAHYKALERRANEFEAAYMKAGKPSIMKGRGIWREIAKKEGIQVVDPEKYNASGQDLVEQLICGAGWRIIASNENPETLSYMLSSSDTEGARFIVTALRAEEKTKTEANKVNTFQQPTSIPHHFQASTLSRFLSVHNSKPGVAVLGFEAESGEEVEKIMQNYSKKHPKLIVNKAGWKPWRYAAKDGEQVFGEAYAYYDPKDANEPDMGTIIRFVGEATGKPLRAFHGLTPCKVMFPKDSYPAYCDHWVSNVFDRKRFLQTLNDVLGFTPKVDFNAGVVAAGEAIIESTVTGNSSDVLSSADKALKSHDQVYLPINNALSTVGHVHLFLQELGQGIQHVASRVSNVVKFVATVNRRRQTTGLGFSFLRIPRSYYGRLALSDLISACQEKNFTASEPEELAKFVLKSLEAKEFVSLSGIAKLDISSEDVQKVVEEKLPGDLKPLWETTKSRMCECVLRSRYNNLYKLLRDHFSPETYLSIVRNQVLVDIQGNDVLFQIFTANILQRNPRDEAPFLEFIQRVCSERKANDGKALPIRPGCGGFGIRNFLTLFLSIEVSKAMRSLEASLKENDEKRAQISQKRVNLLTAQLNESNPILTAISDSMTAESDAELAAARPGGEKDKEEWLGEAERWRKKKLEGNKLLQKVSEKYKALMAEVRKEEAKLM